jgi:thymidylate synthase (FAD)
MAKPIHPKAFLIAETRVDEDAISAALKHLGVESWTSDAATDADLLTEFAGKSCYMSFDTSLNQNLTKVGGRNNHDYIQQGIIANKHGSVLEHATVTFFLANVSRVVTHEIVRHRAGVAYSQTSGRYVRNDEISYYIPKDIYDEGGHVLATFTDAFQQMEENARKLVSASNIDSKSFSLKKRLTSAFRRIIGNGQANHIVVTANHRAWRHMVEMRTDPHAEEEIRVVFADISRQLRERFPTIYADAQVSEVDGIEVTKFEHSKV